MGMIEVNIELFMSLTLIVTGVVQALKRAKLPQDLAPLASIIVGVGAAFMWGEGTWRDLSLTGVALGLSAAGLYSGIKTTQMGVVKQRREHADSGG